MTICLHIHVRFQVFLSNTNKLQAILWIHLTNSNPHEGFEYIEQSLKMFWRWITNSDFYAIKPEQSKSFDTYV